MIDVTMSEVTESVDIDGDDPSWQPGPATETFLNGSLAGATIVWIAVLPVPTIIAVRLLRHSPETAPTWVGIGLGGGLVIGLLLAILLPIVGVFVVGGVINFLLDIGESFTAADRYAVGPRLPNAVHFFFGATFTVALTIGLVMVLVPVLGGVAGSPTITAAAGTQWNPSAVAPLGHGASLAFLAGFQLALGWFFPLSLEGNLTILLEILLE